MKRPAVLGSACLALLSIACQSPPKQGEPALASPGLAASLLRLPRGGGQAAVYRLPDLSATVWQAREALPGVTGLIGVAQDDRVVYLSGRSGTVLALDLESGQVRQPLDHVRAAAVGPDGVLYAVTEDSRAVKLVHRTRQDFNARLPGRPARIFGTLEDHLIAAVPGSKPELVMLRGDQASERIAVPAGDVALTMWGELAAVAADSGIVLYDLRGTQDPSLIDVNGAVKLVGFSPSGHRLYASGASPDIVTLDRYTGRKLGLIELPGRPADYRFDPLGQYLLVRPEHPDSVWVVDLARRLYLRTWATPWTDDLPAVGAGHILLLRDGKDVAAFDLAADLLPEVGRVRGGAGDLWVPLPWVPGPGSSTPRRDTVTVAHADTAVQRDVYLQVSSSRNPDWAEDLARKLREAGLPARVLPPRQDADAYRVVLGPYTSRDEAEEAGQKLGRPFFVYQPEQ
ncbi:MAG: SPOR domain-containing protein [Gemmatimonadales bacterium]